MVLLLSHLERQASPKPCHKRLGFSVGVRLLGGSEEGADCEVKRQSEDVQMQSAHVQRLCRDVPGCPVGIQRSCALQVQRYLSKGGGTSSRAQKDPRTDVRARSPATRALSEGFSWFRSHSPGLGAL